LSKSKQVLFANSKENKGQKIEKNKNKKKGATAQLGQPGKAAQHPAQQANPQHPFLSSFSFSYISLLPYRRAPPVIFFSYL
jgi:hypothetical protein